MKLTLLHPIPMGKTQISSLTFREHTTAGDYLAFDRSGGVAQAIALIANLTGTDEEAIKRIHGSDYKRAKVMADELLDKDEKEAEDASDTPAEGEDAGTKKLPVS